MVHRLKALAGSLIFLIMAGEVASARCYVSLPRSDWKRLPGRSGAEFQCRNESCGGKDYILRFGDDRLRTLGKFNIAPPVGKNAKARAPLMFDNLPGSRMDHDHGGSADMVEVYFGKNRMIGFYSMGRSRKMVRSNFAKLKNATKCR